MQNIHIEYLRSRYEVKIYIFLRKAMANSKMHGVATQATAFLVLAILVLATAVPDIQVVMSFGGSLGGTFIAFMSLWPNWAGLTHL